MTLFLVAAAGIGVMSMVIAAMVLITPAGSEDLPGNTDAMGSSLSAAPSDAAASAATGSASPDPRRQHKGTVPLCWAGCG